MEKIEWKSPNPTFRNCLKAQVVGFLLYRRSRIYLTATFYFVFGIAIAVTEAPKYRYLLFLPIVFVLGMWMSSFIRLFRGALDVRKSITMLSNNHTNYLEEKGFGFEDDFTQVFYQWHEFMSFWETKSFFFLQYKTGNFCVIFKNLLSYETVSDMRKVLESAPVEDKHLHSNK